MRISGGGHYTLKQVSDMLEIGLPTLNRYLAEGLRERLNPEGTPPLYTDEDLKLLRLVATLDQRGAATPKTFGPLLEMLIEASQGNSIPFLTISGVLPIGNAAGSANIATSLAQGADGVHHVTPKAIAPTSALVVAEQPAASPITSEAVVAFAQAGVALADVARELHRSRVEEAAASREFLDAEQAAAFLYPFAKSSRSVSRLVKPIRRGVWARADLQRYLDGIASRNSDSEQTLPGGGSLLVDRRGEYSVADASAEA